MKLSEHPPQIPRNASAVAVDVIRDAIAEGRLEPGERLKEEELAREFGISRTPIREALLVLQAEGLVAAAANRGASVRSYRADDLNDMYLLRGLLEGHAAQRAAATITPDQLQVLQESVERFVQLRLEDVGELVKENAVFHDTILDAARSERLHAMVRQVVPLAMQYRSWMWYSQKQLELVLSLPPEDPRGARSAGRTARRGTDGRRTCSSPRTSSSHAFGSSNRRTAATPLRDRRPWATVVSRPLVEFVCSETLASSSLVTPLSLDPVNAKVLAGDVAAGDGAVLVELPAGWLGRPGDAETGFELVVLEGELLAGDEKAGTGELRRAPCR